MSESMWGDGPGPLQDVHEGMTVFDSDGQELGTVAELKMGDAGVATPAGQQMPTQDDLVTTFARAIWSGSELPEHAAARLIRVGYLRIDRSMARDLYVAADQIAQVQPEQVRLSVVEDELVQAG